MPILRPGKVYQKTVLRNGREATIRAPDWRDLDDFTVFINELVEEHAEILRTEKVSLNEEAKWLGERLAAVEQGNMIALVGEIDGKALASSEVRLGSGQQSHVGWLGIAILKDGRSIGLGTTMMNSLINLSKQAGLKILILDVFATNAIARRLYEKVGFVEVGKIPKAINRDGTFIDIVRMAAEL